MTEQEGQIRLEVITASKLDERRATQATQAVHRVFTHTCKLAADRARREGARRLSQSIDLSFLVQPIHPMPVFSVGLGLPPTMQPPPSAADF